MKQDEFIERTGVYAVTRWGRIIALADSQSKAVAIADREQSAVGDVISVAGPFWVW